MTPGQRMLRIDDGRLGTVEEIVDNALERVELRIVHYDRGERLIASRREKWVPYNEIPTNLRHEERMLVARSADRMLRSLEKHEPHRYWESPTQGEIHDPGLVETILEYLKGRDGRASALD